MNKSDSINELAQALAKAQGQMTPAKMEATNPFLKNKYADLGNVIQAARKALTDNGLSFSQHPAIDDGSVSITTVLMHASGQWMESTLSLPIGEEKGLSLAQSMGKVVTYLRRYSLSAVLGIYADEDTDGNDEKTAGRPNARPAQTTTPARTNAPVTVPPNGKPHQPPAQYSPAAVINGQAVVQTVVGYITKEQFDDHAESLANADDQRTDDEIATALLIAQVTKAQVIDHMVEKTNLARQHVESTLTKCSLTAAATLDDFEAWWDLYRGERATGKTSDEAATYANNTMLAQPA